MYLVWRWDWIPKSPSPDADDHVAQPDGPPGHQSDCEIDDAEEDTEDEPRLHTVRFKCIGANRDSQQQEALERANELRHDNKDVRVGLFPEPNNPVDSKAIAFKCLLDDQQWHRIGYIVREATDDVHEAIATNAIESVEFGWVKFRIDLSRTGPGFYAGVDITRRGQWSSTVCKAASPS